MVAAAIKQHDSDPARVFITGLSAGGAMAAAMLATYPELFAGGAVIAGLAYGVARGVPDALRVMSRGDGRDAAALGGLVQRGGASPLLLSIWQGDADHTVNAANARDLVRQWTNARGLAETPGEVARLGKRSRSIWRGSGGSVLELNIMHGLGHGAPLSTKAQGDVGQPAPYMLETGVSSTLEIAAFWGLSTSTATSRRDTSVDATAQISGDVEAAAAPDSGEGVGARVMDAVSGHVPSQVRDVIAAALRSAGLLR